MEPMRTKVVFMSLAALTGVLLLAPAAWAQSSSAIAGVVKNAAGTPVAGVKVEASSLALIEKVRTATTDGQGQYKIIDLPIGVYDVTFSAAGFSTVKNVGVDLPAQFTATVSAALKAGSPGETITVTAGASLIDTQSTTQVSTTTSDTFESAPTGAKQVGAVGAQTAGLTGGEDTSGAGGVSSGFGGSFHGKTGGGNKTQFDGYRIQNQQGLGNSLYIINTDGVNSVALETGGTDAMSIASGFAANMVPKSGSNRFTGSFGGLYANDKLQSDNVIQAYKDRGLTQTDLLRKQYDIGGTLGGPISKDKLWFFTADRTWGTSKQAAGPIYYNATQGTPFYTPDLTRSPWIKDNSILTTAVRLTWQASPKHKFRFFADRQDVPTPGGANQFNAPEAATSAWRFLPQALFQGTWSSPVTRKLLLEAGFGTSINHWTANLPPLAVVGPNDISFLELTNGVQYNSWAAIITGNSSGLAKTHTGDRFSQRFIVSYTTGSHAFKTGIQWEEGMRDHENVINQSVQYSVRAAAGQTPTTGWNKVTPEAITEFTMPYFTKERIKADLGLFVQDLWTMKRASINYGIRYDYFNAFVPEQHMGAGPFVGARDFAPVTRVPDFSDLSPRVGVAYDLTGNGKTALKVAYGKYVGPADLSIAGLNNPMVTSINQTTRSWTDANGDFNPDCVLTNPAANGECGAIANQNFGKLNTSALSYADTAIHGYGRRDYNWDFSMEVQHQLAKSMSVSAGYYRSWYGNFILTDNVALTAADFNSFCVTAPKDARLPGGGSYPVCGLFDINPAKFGTATEVVTQSSNFGDGKRVNDFFNVTLTTRFSSGIKLGGGVDWGQIVKDDCFASSRPDLTTQLDLNTPRTANAARVYCHEASPWMENLQVKANVSYPLPGDAAVSAVYQNVAGPRILANFPAPNALVVPSLGRSLAGGTKSVTVPLIEPGTQFEDRRTQFDLRATKKFKLGPKMRLQANFDAYNIFNFNPIVSRNNTFGASWGRVNSILAPRLIQFSGQVSF